MKLSEVPRELIEYSKSNFKKDDFHSVLFFGSYDYALIPGDCIRLLEEDWEELSKKNGGNKFKQAVEEAKKYISRPITKKTTAAEKKEPAGKPAQKDLNSLPTNAFIVIDPETGEQTVRKRRGRPPKVRPDGPSTLQIKPAAVPRSGGKRAAAAAAASGGKRHFTDGELQMYSRKLQKILLRPELKSVEIPIAVHMVDILFRKRICTLAQLQTSDIGKVLAHAMKRGSPTWRPYPEMLDAFNFVLRTWKGLPKD